MHRSPVRVATATILVIVSVTPATAVSPAGSNLESEVVPPIVHRITDDGPEHPLTVGAQVDEFQDLLVTSDGSVMVSSLHDGRTQNGAFDAWPMRVWTLGEPGVSEVLIPTAASGLAEGPEGAIYLAGEGRFLARLDGTQWVILNKQQDVAAYRDHAIAEDGTVWAAFGDKLFSFDGEGWVRSRFDDGGKRAQSLERTTDGNLWMHLGDRLLQLDGKRWVDTQPGDAPQRIRVLSIDTDPDGELWAVMDNSVGACDPIAFPIGSLDWDPVTGDQIRPRLTSPGPSTEKTRRCQFHGELLAGSVDGWVVRGRSIENLTDSIGSLSVGGRHIQHAEADGDGNIWVLAPDRDRKTSDLYLIETGAGD